MTSTLPPLLQAISGAVGSASANTLTYPLDLVTTRIQLQKPSQRQKSRGITKGARILQHIIDRHGLSALYDGLSTDTFATLLSNFFYFYFYSYLRNLALRSRGGKSNLTMASELFLGFLAGVASRAVSNPLNLITLRLQTEQQDAADAADFDDEVEDDTPDVLSVIKRIYQERGVLGFWRGFETTILLSINPSITLALFQLLLRVTRSRTIKPTPREAFLGGAVSNSIAIALLYPLILAKTRLQARKTSDSTLVSVLHDASRTRSLYQGLDLQIAKGFLSQGVTFLIKERIEQFVVNLYLRRKRS